MLRMSLPWSDTPGFEKSFFPNMVLFFSEKGLHWMFAVNKLSNIKHLQNDCQKYSREFDFTGVQCHFDDKLSSCLCHLVG